MNQDRALQARMQVSVSLEQVGAEWIVAVMRT
jgi:hypothetical protein